MGRFFGVLNLLIQHVLGTTTGPNTINYYGGGALGGALIGVLVVRIAATWRR